MEDDRKEVATFGLITLIIGVWFGFLINGYLLRKQAVQNECAHYDGKTGEFKWGLPQ
jgi:hypothetical protein